MNLVSKNNVVACKPFDTKVVDPGKGLALVTKKCELVRLYPLWDADSATPDLCVTNADVILVKAECSIKPWAKEVFKVDGVKDAFILVPLTEIVFIDRNGRKVN